MKPPTADANSNRKHLDDDFLNTLKDDGYKSFSSSRPSDSYTVRLSPVAQHQSRRHSRKKETHPEQYSRSRNRRRPEHKTYYAPGRDKSREISSKHAAGNTEDESRSLEASLDDLEDPPDKNDLPERDKDQKVEEDSGEDKQAAESSSDPSELMVKQAPDENADGSGSETGDDTQTDGTETTTEAPASTEEDTSAEQEADSNNEDKDNETTPEPKADDASSGEQPSDELDRNDEEAMKNAGNAIDEEVDRMTQPSIGVASQQEPRPLEYKDTVHFDDTLNDNSETIPRRTLNPVRGPSILDRSNMRAIVDPNIDLQADGHSRRAVLKGPNKIDKASEERITIRKIPQNAAPPNRSNSSRVRHKRSIETIRAPYEIAEFLNGLNFDSLTGKSAATPKRRSRAITNDLSVANSTTALVSIKSNSTTNEPILNEDSRRKEIRLGNSSPDYGNSDYPNDYEDGAALDSEPARNRSSPFEKKKKPNSNRYQYLKSNDTGLQDLLKNKNFIDVLKQSKLPAPYDSGGKPNKTSSNDHSTADSVFTVDHGLLLYPSSDEEHSHHEKSMSDKKKKHESKKGKKKSAISIKKGGSKKKKHKKEEKKYHKEKKFKGAKKGKKMSKGKGGQGGKKGKKHYKDKGFKKKGFKNVYHKEEFGQKKSYFDEYRDKDFKKKWKKYDDKYNYAQMKKWQAKDIKKAKKMKDHGMKYKKYDKSRYKKKHQSHEKKHSQSSSKKKKSKGMGF